MDELESELRTLDREIAQFVLEAFQREAPDALRAQLASAMAEGLAPIRRALDAIAGDLGRSGQDSVERVASLQADLAERAQYAQEQSERRAFELQQALAKVRSELGLARRDIQQLGGGRAPLAVAEPHDDADDPPDRRFAQDEGGWWRRRWPWVAGGVAAVAVAAGVALVVLRPAGSTGSETGAGGARLSAADGTPASAAGPAAPDQDGFARVVAQVSGSWTGDRRKAALETLCGPGADKDGCPDLRKRWLAGERSRKEEDEALAVTVAALAETDGCKAPVATAEATAGRPGRPAETRRGAAPDAGSAGAADADPAAATLDCLLTEAGRAPRP